MHAVAWRPRPALSSHPVPPPAVLLPQSVRVSFQASVGCAKLWPTCRATTHRPLQTVCPACPHQPPGMEAACREHCCTTGPSNVTAVQRSFKMVTYTSIVATVCMTSRQLKGKQPEALNTQSMVEAPQPAVAGGAAASGPPCDKQCAPSRVFPRPLSTEGPSLLPKERAPPPSPSQGQVHAEQ